jgi:integrase
MRSQIDARSGRQTLPNGNVIFSNLHGTVRVYTRRHINGCPLTSPNQQDCRCPKWIYANPSGGKPQRIAAGTPSFTEACEQAQKLLRGFDPDIRAAREITQPAPGLSIEETVERYLGVLQGRKLSDNYLSIVSANFRRRRPRKDGHGKERAVQIPSLLDFLDRENLLAAVPVTRMEQVTSAAVKRWQSSWRANDSTSRILRIKAKSFFVWALGEGYLDRLPVFDKGQALASGNRCGYFTDEQYTRLIEALPFFPVPHSGRMEEKRPPVANYAARLRAFIEAGRWGGMAIRDIVMFRPAENLEGNVLAYRRHKNRRKRNSSTALVELFAEVAERLRTVPAETGSSAEQPFFFPGTTLDQNCVLWRKRFQRLCAFAGIKEVETQIGTVRLSHPHMLRDTCAIDAITHGVPIGDVAKMLGHSTTEITERNYLFWVQKRLDSCLANQRAALARRLQPAAVPASARQHDAIGSPLVH